MREDTLRRILARRLRQMGPYLVSSGALAPELFESHVRRTDTSELEVQECVWTRVDGQRIEMDIVVWSAHLAVECKTYHGAAVPWEEALGQALRDRRSAFVDRALIAVPEAAVNPLMVSTCRASGVGILTVMDTPMNFRAVDILLDPQVASN